jgi:hypothetical protein
MIEILAIQVLQEKVRDANAKSSRMMLSSCLLEELKFHEVRFKEEKRGMVTFIILEEQNTRFFDYWKKYSHHTKHFKNLSMEKK